MKHRIILLILFLVLGHAAAQVEPSRGLRQGFIRLMPTYQSWTEAKGRRLAEFSVPLYARLAYGRDLSFALRGSQATASGNNFQKLSGLTDTQLSINYKRGNVVFNLGLNFPSGKKELTTGEFQTAAALSLNHYNFQTPNYGQGLNLSPGINWAAPIGENSAVGLGASFQYKGRFKPLEFVAAYDPGDELLLTGGGDWRLSESAKFSVDLIFMTYGDDRINGEKVFAAGNRILLNAQFRQSFDHDELWLFARYISKGRNSLAVGGALLPESQKSSPDQLDAIGQYWHRFSPRFSAALSAESRYFTNVQVAAATLSSAGVNVVGLGVAPEFSPSAQYKIPARLKYLFGRSRNGKNMSGFEISLGNASDPKTRFYLGMAFELEQRLKSALTVYATYSRFSRLSSYRNLMKARHHLLARRMWQADLRALLAQERQLSADSVAANAVAVFPLRYQGKNLEFAALSRGLADMLITDLSQVRRLEVIDRVRVQALLDEMTLGQSGLVDEATAAKFGRLVRAGKILRGAYEVSEQNRLKPDLAILDVQNQQFPAPMTRTDALKNLLLLEKELVFQTIAEMGIELTAIEREKIQRLPTQNFRAFLFYCTGLAQEDAGEFEQATKSYLKAAQLDPQFTLAIDKAELMESFMQIDGKPDEALAGALTLEQPVEIIAAENALVEERLQNLGENMDSNFVAGQNSRDATEADLNTPLLRPPSPPKVPPKR
jgi:TolB-like protein